MTNELTLPLPRLTIKSYRGLEKLEFKSLGQINLIVGANNCGKTTVLDYILGLKDSSGLLEGRFHKISLSSMVFRGAPGWRSPEESSQVLELLAIADPMITWLNEKRAVFYRGALVALADLGTGVGWLYEIATNITRAENGVLLIDDAEMGLHPAIMCKAFAWIVRWAKKHNVQMFLTTHSLDLVDALIDATGGWGDPADDEDDEDDIPEGDLDLVLFRLEPRDEETRVVRHGRGRLRRLRGDLGVNVLL